MSARFYPKVGGLIACLAILMASLAPTISHIVAASRRADAICTTSSMPERSAGALWAGHHGNDGAGDSKSRPASGDDCGYCGLFAHTPAVPIIALPFVAIVWATVHQMATRFDSVRRREPVGYFQPRAPPALR
ncbi:MAG TPA: DUF2946 domain-containing protein [Trinickia sp.]|jgi:hypothetical protein|uniref:DUF2946 domain-containing protein n=1 Tax=Trinickia sp. TaxID=2571163 RepID=UPI002BFDF247|nr:DUF2946 domain-containing protein [Trinickia sp.]HTI19324.1 DUF2946 domain-containing protein [Trinickia sp.]